MSWEIKIITDSDYCPYANDGFCCFLLSEHHVESCNESKCPLKIKEKEK